LGWVHRDLKFNNVMVKGSAIYLIDFGAAYKPPVKKNCGSVYGNLRFLSENAHSYFQQTFTDDI
jgi:tRNA A-37 threonylcarbamoyl transferase component Bud32